MKTTTRTLGICLATAVLAANAMAPGQGQGRAAPAGRSATAPAADGRQGLDALSEDRLMSELATRRLDTLLNYFFEANNVPPEKRKGVTVLMQLERLRDPTDKTSNAQRQEIVRGVAAGLAEVLPSMKDPRMLMQYAGALITYGMERDINTLEFWGENPRTQAQLRPVAQAVVDLLAKAREEAQKAADAVASRPGFKPDNTVMVKEWERADQLVNQAEYTRNMVLYDLAMAIDKSDAQRKKLAEEAIEYLQQHDNPESGVQPVVRNRIAKLRMAEGDYAEARKLFGPVAQGGDEIKPKPDVAQQYEARYFMALCDLQSRELGAARTALADLRSWQAANLPKDNAVAVRGAEAAADMLEYRIITAEADAAGDAKAKQDLNDKGRALLLALVEKQPALGPIIYEQLIGRLPENVDYGQLNDLELRALLERGDQERLREAEAHDHKTMERAVAAARELGRRKETPKDLADSAAILVPFLLEKLDRPAAAAEAFLDYVQKTPGKYKDVAFEYAGSLVFKLYQENPKDEKAVELYDRLLPVAINPPYNKREFAVVYARRLMLRDQFKEAVDYFKLVPANATYALDAKFMHMIALKGWLDQDGRQLPEAQKLDMLGQIQSLAAAVRQGAQARLTGAGGAAAAEQAAARSMLVKTTLLAADVAHRNQNDSKKALELLDKFEDAVKGMPGEQDLLVRALFIRVHSYMDTGQAKEAAESLRRVLESQGGAGGADLVYGILKQLDQDLDNARLKGDIDDIRQLTEARAALTPYLVQWAEGNRDPEVKKQTYRYKVFDADSQRRAAALKEPESARRSELERVRDQVYKPLQSAENVKLYYDAITDAAKRTDLQRANEGDPTVQLGVGLIEYDLGNWKEARGLLGTLLDKGKLGTGTIQVADPNTGERKDADNDIYWEARFKHMDAIWHLAADTDNAKLKQSIVDDLRLLYVKWRDRIGGKLHKQKFEELRKQIAPDFVVPTTTVTTGGQ